jgi:hypothetical protein
MKQAREMTRNEFNSALKLHNFKKVLFWLVDTSGATTCSYGMVVNRKTGKLMFRASLAKAIRERGA